MQLAEASRSVLRVGDGRGFVVAGDGATYVVTASHCLPHLPQCGSYLTDKQTYQALLGPPGAETTPVRADCVRGRQSLWIVEASEPICEAMSGSPILGADGKAIGICIGTGSDNLGNRRPNPGLVASIPGWLVDELVMPIGAGPDPVRCC